MSTYSITTFRLATIVTLFTSSSLLHADPGHLLQQGNKLVGTGYIPGSRGIVAEGVSVALSADGNTALIGGTADNNDTGAAWAFVRTNGVWTQQGPKLVGTGAVPGLGGAGASQGTVALSADGNTALIGGGVDANGIGAVWVFVRNNGVWTQQGVKLVGSGYNNRHSMVIEGESVALSADGNTAVFGGSFDNNSVGAVWVFTRSNGVWTQQGSKLVGSGGNNSGIQGSSQGWSIALSADGNTVAWGGITDDDGKSLGAVWVFTRQNGFWSQQGDKLIGSGASGLGVAQGASIGLSDDGNTLVFGGPGDNYPPNGQCALSTGALWVFTRENGTWSQQGGKLVAKDPAGCSTPQLGNTVSISADGNAIVAGGNSDGSPDGFVIDALGAAFLFVRSGGVWAQQGSKLVGSGAIGPAEQGSSVAISGDGNTVLVGGPGDNNNIGATWVFTNPALGVTLTHPGVFHPGETGATYTATVTNHGERVTTSAVNLTDRVPTGLIATGISGAGWTCTLATVSCTRADPLAVGATYPPITITVNVALNAPASVTNVATASGGGSAWGNAKDVTLIQK